MLPRGEKICEIQSISHQIDQKPFNGKEVSFPDRPGRTDSAEGLRRAFFAAGAESALPLPSNKTFWSLRPPQIESQGNQR